MMDGVHQDPRAGDADPAAVRLHLHRGIGWGVYGVVTVVVFLLVLVGTVANLTSGRIVTAVVVAVVGLAVTGFLAVVTHALVVPALTAAAAGVSGRMPRGNTVDVGWDEVTIDVDDDVPPGTLRLDVGEESVALSARSWVGFGRFVSLVVNTPDAAARLTPAAQREVNRLLRIEEG
jgi:hypothetical protein